MKTYTAPNGKTIGVTMTVKELREKLAEYPDEMPVFGEWEGVQGYIVPEDFTIEEYCAVVESERELALMIYVGDS
jgi:hypothetical protein